MIRIEDFTPLIGGTVKNLFIVLWPPLCEQKMLDVDISVGLEVDMIEDVAFHVEIDKSDGCTPVISKTEFDELRQWNDFQQRIHDWMSGEIDDPLQQEVFDATHDIAFENIVSREIIDIECVTLKNEFTPFAIKIVFSDDHILVSPISDGTTVETKVFNKLGNLKMHESLGELQFMSILSMQK